MAEDSSATGSISFTEAESKLMVAIMQNLTSDIQFDADTIATQLGYKDGGIVKTRWGQIKRKKLAGGVSPAGIKKRVPSKKATPKKAKEEGDANEDDEAEEQKSPTKTPTKRARKPKASAKVEAKAEAAENDTGIKKEETEDVVESTEEAN